jgi:hypothetical protein
LAECRPEWRFFLCACPSARYRTRPRLHLLGEHDRDRSCDIVVNGVVVAAQILEGRHSVKTFGVACPLPPEALAGQQNLTMLFQCAGKGRVGGLCGLRLEPSRP